MKIIFWMSLLTILFFSLIFLFFYFYPRFLDFKYSLGLVIIKEKVFQVELAKTETQKYKGLMYRDKLEQNNGMLFIFNKEKIYPFWMKNTLIPLDIIWINSNNKVVFISQNTQPCKSLICPQILSNINAKYVLEINAGLCEKLNLQVGDQIEIKY